MSKISSAMLVTPSNMSINIMFEVYTKFEGKNFEKLRMLAFLARFKKLAGRNFAFYHMIKFFARFIFVEINFQN